jgi:lactoylglutathione lyase
MEESLEFYCNKLGLKLVRRREIPENNAEIAFVEGEGAMSQIELTFWKGKEDYSEGDQLDHIAFGVPNVESTVKELRMKGVEVAREPYSLKGLASKIAFIKDPNGIWLELVEIKQ